MRVDRAGIALLVIGVLFGGPRTATAAFVTFDLSAPTVTATTATFEVFMAFSGGASDRVEAIQLSVLGSSPALTASNFSRFSFTPSATGLPGWVELAPIAGTGFNLLAPLDPVNGPFLAPSATPYDLGTLRVNVAGLAGQSLVLTLAGGTPGVNGTDAGGVVNGAFIPSFATAGQAAQVAFTEPGGVRFSVVPEPSGAALLGLGVASLLFFLRRGRGPGSLAA
ncbi:MAG: PEP-CTERM sorting domain-containing protein [Isosphaeraceae bacterium]